MNLNKVIALGILTLGLLFSCSQTYQPIQGTWASEELSITFKGTEYTVTLEKSEGDASYTGNYNIDKSKKILELDIQPTATVYKIDPSFTFELNESELVLINKDGKSKTLVKR